LNIVACVKQTPDTAATVTVDGGRVSWGDSPLVLNPWDEYAVEEALRTKEAHGGKVTAISMGPESAKDALKQALAMGCDEAILLSDSGLEAVDTLGTARVLASAVGNLDPPDLIFFGKASVDSAVGVTFAQTARLLGWPLLSQVAKVTSVDPQAGSIGVERLLPEGREVVEAGLPAVISVTKEINEPRYPSFMGIRKASKADIPVWGLTDLGMEVCPKAKVDWPEIFALPQKETACEIIEGDSPEAMAAKLADRLLEEKVL
jgi:electron transfer flavoprotein beta subunit